MFFAFIACLITALKLKKKVKYLEIELDLMHDRSNEESRRNAYKNEQITSLNIGIKLKDIRIETNTSIISTLKRSILNYEETNKKLSEETEKLKIANNGTIAGKDCLIKNLEAEIAVLNLRSNKKSNEITKLIEEIENLTGCLYKQFAVKTIKPRAKKRDKVY
jgi:predicted RNase H-like nuclease (RuvC/YqgF family)